ncbi:MAG: site-2 protease family protein [Candidatus Brockarchaeota archaeon]|nr:site-2 protease family protein [Candidatus Brockarchaeota archaeon]
MRLRLPSMVEVQFPFILVKTRVGLKLMDRLGGTGFSRKMGLISLVVMPFLGAIMVYLLLNAISNMLSNPSVSRVLRELGPASNILLPGVNPYLPVFYGWVALITAMVIHEYAHGTQARANGMNVKSTGLVLFLIIPVGAFAEVDEKQLEDAGLEKAGRVLSAGPVSNVIAALAALAVFILLMLTLKPVVDGILVVGLSANGTAYQKGMRPGDIIIGVNGEPTPDWHSFAEAVRKVYKLGGNITFTVSRDDFSNYTFTLGRNLSSSGIRVVPLKDVLENYSQALAHSPIEGFVTYLMIPTVPFPWVYEAIPFSNPLQKYYVSTLLGKDYHYLVNFFFWAWFINLNLGIFNALPLYPMDGGVVLKLFCRKKLSRRMSVKTVDKMVYITSLIILGLIMVLIILPYFIR